MKSNTLIGYGRIGMSKKDYQLSQYLNEINFGKKNLMEDEDEFWEKKYPAYIINKCLSAHGDAIFYVNEMNRMHYLDNRLQNDFFINSLSKRKRFAKWIRASKVKDIECIKEYYGYSNEKAKQALRVLTDDQVKTIKRKLIRGVNHGRSGVDSRNDAGGKVKRAR